MACSQFCQHNKTKFALSYFMQTRAATPAPQIYVVAAVTNPFKLAFGCYANWQHVFQIVVCITCDVSTLYYTSLKIHITVLDVMCLTRRWEEIAINSHGNFWLGTIGSHAVFSAWYNVFYKLTRASRQMSSDVLRKLLWVQM